MNILLAADVSMRNVIGGAERALQEEAFGLKRMGHAVDVLTRKLSFHANLEEDIDGVKESRYRCNWAWLWNAGQAYQRLSQNTTFDIIHCHQPFTAYGLNCLRQTSAIKKVYTCHSLSFEEYLSRNPQKNVLDKTANASLRRWIEQFSLSKSDAIIALSRFTKDKLTAVYGLPEAKIHVIPGGSDTQKFFPATDKNLLCQKFQIAADTLVLVTVRNLVPRMGLENLLKACAILKKENIDFQLLICGEGPLKENLELLIRHLQLSNQVRLCGFVPDNQLVEYYQRADFFILPTLELEGFGLVTLEAMACGTPVLGTPVGGTVEILSFFDRSCLFKDASPAAIAQGIREKYAYYKLRPEEYHKLRRQARQFVEKNYDCKKNIQQVEALFQSLLK